MGEVFFWAAADSVRRDRNVGIPGGLSPMRRRDYPIRVAALLAMTTVLSLSVAGCGDDDVISGDNFEITINAPVQ